MKEEDYLWDKTGQDSEIEEFENTLKTFRAKNSVPPEIPARTFVFDNQSLKSKKPRFAFRFAFLSVISMVIFSIGIFQFVQFEDRDLAQKSAPPNVKQITKQNVLPEAEVAQKITDNRSSEDKSSVRDIEQVRFTPKPKVRKKTAKAIKKIQPKIKRNLTIARNIKATRAIDKPKNKTVKLTQEEKEAYEKLMEALAITGSQMRIVQAKIKGFEESQTPKKAGR